MDEQGVASADEEAEEREAWLDAGWGWWRVEGLDESRGQGVRLHVVDCEEWYLPCHRETFGEVNTDGEVASHAWAAGDGDEVWAALDGAIVEMDWWLLWWCCSGRCCR